MELHFWIHATMISSKIELQLLFSCIDIEAQSSKRSFKMIKNSIQNIYNTEVHSDLFFLNGEPTVSKQAQDSNFLF